LFSGDCRPSKELQTIGKGCDLLIHEATFDDSMQLDALNKKHTTTSEALLVGKNMGAKHILLTHFSQRYPVSSVQKCETDNIIENRNYSLAFDLLTFSYPSQIDSLPSLTQFLSLFMENLHNKLQNQKNQNAM
jgi:ribonuclease BN (tRNA processing enzyme)